MRYEIENRNDLSGAQLVIRFPEEDLDQKALYTIQAEPPGFLVPFRYRSIDGQAEVPISWAAAANCNTAMEAVSRRSILRSGSRY